MQKIFSLLVLCALAIPFQIFAQLRPSEGQQLNYRLAGFSFPASPKATGYTIRIAEGTYTNAAAFGAHILSSTDCPTNKSIIEIPSFGKNYTWSVVSKKNGAILTTSKLYHFSTLPNPCADTSVSRMKILANEKKYTDAYVFADGAKALYNMNGKPVWFLPAIAGLDVANSLVRDLKLTTRGTITFLVDGVDAYEITYDGALLWKTPDVDKQNPESSVGYHHQFTRLSNGHYMVLGSELVIYPEPVPGDTVITFTQGVIPAATPGSALGVPYRRCRMGTILEYDTSGHVAWSWKSAAYFSHSDIAYHKGGGPGGISIQTHENGFYFDEANKNIYVSFRDINRVVKLKYPGGDVVNNYGTKYSLADPAPDNNLFCGQHNCSLDQKGYLCIFNNNICHAGQLPKVSIFKEPLSAKDTLQQVWEYTCTAQDIPNMTANGDFTTGGSVTELPDQSMLVSMSAPYNKIFIINWNKEVLWSAVTEKYDPEKKEWIPATNYRTSIIPDKTTLEQLIWYGQGKE